jgi:general secretion pathway protein G
MVKSKGFTLIELLVVLAIIALLLTLAMPRYFSSLDRAKVDALRHDLATMREAIDKYYGDNGQYPDSLNQLVEKKYLRAIPPDPLTDSSDTWVVEPPKEGQGAVYDVRSGARGQTTDGKEYGEL